MTDLYVASASVPTLAWQPIETAPKHGGELLLLSDGKEVWFGLWMKGIRIADYWGNFEVGGGISFPTHWMPILEPPEISGRNLADATP